MPRKAINEHSAMLTGAFFFSAALINSTYFVQRARKLLAPDVLRRLSPQTFSRD